MGGIGPRATPTISDEGLFAVGPQGMLVCLNPISGKDVARIPMIESKTWNHPIVVGNRVYARNSQEAACFEFATK